MRTVKTHIHCSCLSLIHTPSSTVYPTQAIHIPQRKANIRKWTEERIKSGLPSTGPGFSRLHVSGNMKEKDVMCVAALTKTPEEENDIPSGVSRSTIFFPEPNEEGVADLLKRPHILKMFSVCFPVSGGVNNSKVYLAK